MANDIFDNTILCNKCGKKMQKANVSKNGFLLRALACENCHEKILHPIDVENYNKFISLQNKEFNVKMRLVGNSYAVSIPKEIVSFMNTQREAFSDFDKMVKLCFEEMGRLSLSFGKNEDHGTRIIKSREIKVVRNNKPVLHSRQFYDSAHPERSQKIIRKGDHIKNDR